MALMLVVVVMVGVMVMLIMSGSVKVLPRKCCGSIGAVSQLEY